MLIKIINGGYGHHEHGRVVYKDKSCEAFEVDAKEAQHLVEIGIAEYAAVATPAEPCSEDKPSENSSDGKAAVEGAEEAEYDERTPMNVLREIATSRGIKTKVGMKKAELLALLDESDEAAPELSAESPVE